MGFCHSEMEGSDALIPNVKALLVYRKGNGLVTSMGTRPPWKIRERERERQKE